MKETVIIDLAILEHDTEHCPVCSRLLTMSTALYRYPHKNGCRTSYIKVLLCPSCRQYYGSYALLNKVKTSDSSGDRNSKLKILPYHVFNEMLAKRETAARNYSIIETRERVVPPKFDRKSKTLSQKNAKRAELQQILRAEKLEAAEILETKIDIAPPPSRGPLAGVKYTSPSVEQIINESSEEKHEIYDLTVLAPYRVHCPKCKSLLVKRSASYHYQVNNLPRVYLGVLSFCEKCKQYYGTIEWLDALEKRAPDDEVTFQYHYFGMLSSEEDETQSVVSKKQEYIPENKSIRSPVNRRIVPHYQMKSFEEALKETEGPDDAILILQYGAEDLANDETLFLVKNQKSSNGTKRIYFTNSTVGNAVIEAVLMDSQVFNLNGYQYTIYNVYKRRDFDDAVAGRERIMRVLQHPKEMVDVYVYELKGLCRRHGDLTEKLVVNMISSRSQDPHPLEVYYCPLCRKFYVNYETYLRFYRRYGMPPLRLYGDSEKSGADNQFASLRQHSDLNLFGYTVSGELGENNVFRHALLEDIIDSGNLTKAQVTSHLEWLIRFGRNNEKMFFARTRWQNDLEYIENYQPVRTNIFGEFKPGRTRIFL